MSPRGEAKQQKGTHEKERERERIVLARVLLSQQRESFSSAYECERFFSLIRGKRTIGMRERERTGARARVKDRRKSMRRKGGNVRIYYNYKTANKK